MAILESVNVFLNFFLPTYKERITATNTPPHSNSWKILRSLVLYTPPPHVPLKHLFRKSPLEEKHHMFWYWRKKLKNLNLNKLFFLVFCFTKITGTITYPREKTEFFQEEVVHFRVLRVQKKKQFFRYTIMRQSHSLNQIWQLFVGKRLLGQKSIVNQYKLVWSFFTSVKDGWNSFLNLF